MREGGLPVGTMSKLIVCIGIGGLMSATAFAEEDKIADKGKEGLLRDIFAAWKERPTRLRTLVCSAGVETFYPRGWMPDYEDREGKAKWGDRMLPEKDTRFTADSSSWAFDFAKERVRIESHLTGTWGMPGDQEFHVSHGLHLFKDGIYSKYYPGQSEQERHDPRTGALRADALIGRQMDSKDMFSFAELPFLWSAGGVNGKYPVPTEMHYLEDPERFIYRGEVVWNQRRCVVLSIQEQESSTAVREFWVDAEPPYLIRSCRSRDGDRPMDQIDVDYREQDGLDLPAKWTFRVDNWPFGQLFMTRTYTVQNMRVNVPLPDDLFTKTLEPGMIVRAPETDDTFGTFEVDRDGSLVPLGSARSKSHWHYVVAWSGIGLALVVGTVLGWLRRRHRSVS
jgi:hypothetical protein